MKKKISAFALAIGIMSSLFVAMPITANATDYLGQYYFRGDANGDSKINIKDIIAIRNFLAGGRGEIIVDAAADTNKDGNIDGEDIVVLRQYIASGYDVELMELYDGGNFEIVVPDSWNNREEGEKVNNLKVLYEGEEEILIFPAEIIDPDDFSVETDEWGYIINDDFSAEADIFDYIIWQ